MDAPIDKELIAEQLRYELDKATRAFRLKAERALESGGTITDVERLREGYQVAIRPIILEMLRLGVSMSPAPLDRQSAA